MTEHPNHQGPGEDVGPHDLQGEANNVPVPEGEMSRPDALYEQRDLPPKPARREDFADGDAPDPHVTHHRTGIDLKAVAFKRGEGSAPEARVDHTVEELPRETVFDPAQDDTGLLPDTL